MRLLALLLLLAFVSAQQPLEYDEESGCARYEGYILCPGTIDVEAVPVRLVSGANCSFVVDEEGLLEELGCYAAAELEQDLDFKECKSYVPYDRDRNIILENVSYERDCVAKKWRAGTAFDAILSKEQLHDCTKLEGDENYEIYGCAVAGEKLLATGVIGEEAGERYFMVLASEKQRVADLTVIAGIVVVLLGLVAVAYVWSKKKAGY